MPAKITEIGGEVFQVPADYGCLTEMVGEAYQIVADHGQLTDIFVEVFQFGVLRRGGSVRIVSASIPRAHQPTESVRLVSAGQPTSHTSEPR